MKLRVLISCALFFCASAFAISLYVGYVEGKITDESGAVLKGAKIVITPKSSDSKEGTQSAPANCDEMAKKKGSQKATSGPNGRYKFVAVRPGQYTICFGLEGYQTVFQQTEIKQAVTNTFNITLKKPVAQSETQSQPQSQ